MKTQKTLFEQFGGTYTQTGDFLLPDLTIEESKPIGEYGRMRRNYLKEQRPVLFSELVLSGKLFEHLAEIDRTCHERIELITMQMAEREGVTETLKAADQFEWIIRMSSIQSRVEEIVLSELVYC